MYKCVCSRLRIGIFLHAHLHSMQLRYGVDISSPFQYLVMGKVGIGN